MAKTGSPRKTRGRETPNSVMRDTAHRRLDEMLNLAESAQEYGTFGVDVEFEAGVITRIPQRFKRSDKPAST